MAFTELEDEDKEMQFFVSRKGPFVVVAFVGHFEMSEEEDLNRCLKEILAEAPQFVILSMRDVNAMKRTIVPAFIRFQKQIRDQNCQLRIAALSPDIKRTMISLGAVRHDELENNLQNAILSLKEGSQRKVA